MSAMAEKFPRPVRSVLVVEDDEDTRESLAEFLAARGFVVYTAENGRRALDLLDALPLSPGCILLDLDMPVMDGWELMVRLRGRPDVPPVIVLTGSDAEPPAGARYYLTKPASLDELMRAVVSCSLRWGLPIA